MIWLLIGYVVCLNKAGIYNSLYEIPYDIGSRVREWDSTDVILNDKPSLISWGYNYNIDYLKNLWVTDQVNNKIFYISKEEQSFNAIFHVAGTEVLKGESTSRNGNLAKATFLKPSSVTIFDSNSTRMTEMQNLTPFFLVNNSTHTWNKRLDCIHGNGLNFTYYSIGNYTQEDDRKNPCGLLIDTNLAALYEVIDHKRVKYISLYRDYEPFSYEKDKDPREAYVADTGNHCIRKLSVEQAYVSTVAGICGKPGFADGPLSQNMLNSPELVAVDAEGYLFIYDAGNSKIRMMHPKSTEVTTMIDGTCRQDLNQQPPQLPFQIKLRTMVCYKAWLETVITVDQFQTVQIVETPAVDDAAPPPEANNDETTVSDTPVVEDPTVNLGLDPCWNVHPVICASHPKHPLIRDRGVFYLQREEQLAIENMVRELKPDDL